MKFPHKFFKLSQKGFTGVELLIALTIGSLIMGGVVAVMYQMWTNNARCVARVTAVKQVESALHFISRDVQMAQVIQTDNLPAGDLIKLTWLNMDNATSQVTYSLNEGNLVRTDISCAQQSIAHAIESFDIAGGLYNHITITITCSITSPQPVSETRVVEILPRCIH